MTEPTAKPMGALLPGIVDSQTGVTASPEPLTTPAALMDLTTLPARIDDETMGLLREIATAALPTPVSCDDEHFARCMKSLDILPRRADDTGGPLRLKLYRRKLGGFENGALSFLVDRGLERFQFFPSIKECLDLLRAFPNRDRDAGRRGHAKSLIEREQQHRLHDAILAMRRREFSQTEIDALPAKWKQIAAEKMLLWAWPDGRFTVRRNVEAMDADEAEAERERVRAMMDEWADIRAAQAAREDQQEKAA